MFGWKFGRRPELQPRQLPAQNAGCAYRVFSSFKRKMFALLTSVRTAGPEIEESTYLFGLCAVVNGRRVSTNNCCVHHPKIYLDKSDTPLCRGIALGQGYAKISFTLSRTCLLRDGFRYRMVLSKSECPSHCCTVRRSTPLARQRVAKVARNL